MKTDASSFLDAEDIDSFGAVPRIAGIGTPIAITQMDELSEGKILGQVSSVNAFDFGKLADENSRASWLG